MNRDDDTDRYISWYAWQAERLNRIFFEQGKRRELGRITADTIRRGVTMSASSCQTEPGSPEDHFDPASTL